MPRLHSGVAQVYRQKVAELTAARNRDELRTEATETLRSLIARDGALIIELVGALAGILALGKEERPQGWALGAFDSAGRGGGIWTLFADCSRGRGRRGALMKVRYAAATGRLRPSRCRSNSNRGEKLRDQRGHRPTESFTS